MSQHRTLTAQLGRRGYACGMEAKRVHAVELVSNHSHQNRVLRLDRKLQLDVVIGDSAAAAAALQHNQRLPHFN